MSNNVPSTSVILATMKSTIVTVLILLLYISCDDSTSKKEIVESFNNLGSSTSVRAKIIDTLSFKRKLISNGLLVANQKSDLRFKISEQVKNIYVQNGQIISKGSIIATLDNSLLDTQLESAKNQLFEAERNLQNEKIRFEVSNQPDEKINPDVLRTLYQNSGYKIAKNELETVKVLYEQTVLRAPFSGRIANLYIKEGSFVSPNDIFCTLISSNKLDVVFHVFESEFNTINENQPISASPFFSNNVILKGNISDINPVVNSQGLIRITARLLETNESLFDGMNVRVSVDLELNGVLIIPKEALVLRSNREVVFTVENNMAQWNYVEIEDENDKYYAISEGLKAKDTIIISGNLNLTQDAKVKVTLPESEL